MLAAQLDLPDLKECIRRYLYHQLNPADQLSGWGVPLEECPRITDNLHIKVRHNITCIFFSPNETIDPRGRHRELIRANPCWGKKKIARHDCIFATTHPDADQYEGLDSFLVGQVHFFFNFEHEKTEHNCALIRWMETVGDAPCPITRMWKVEPFLIGGQRHTSIINVKSIRRATHLMGINGEEFLDRDFKYHETYERYESFFVNKFIDGHTHMIAF